jgi:hypothetical protein
MTNGARQVRGTANHSIVVIAIGVMIVTLIGCVSTTSARPRNEPGVIVIRNSTAETLAAVRIEHADASSGGARRLGEMAPVMPDFNYAFERSELAPALPRRATVRWSDGAGREFSAVVDIAQVLKQARGGDDESLLFEILPGGQVQARIETAPPSP